MKLLLGIVAALTLAGCVSSPIGLVTMSSDSSAVGQSPEFWRFTEQVRTKWQKMELHDLYQPRRKSPEESKWAVTVILVSVAWGAFLTR